jgi:site-specific recombinase XerD
MPDPLPPYTGINTGLPRIKNNETFMEDYFNFLRLQDLKHSTLRARTWSLIPFFQFVDYKPANEVTRKDIENFAVYLKTSGKKKSTQRKNLIEVRDFYNYMLPENDYFAAIKLRREKPDHSKKEYVTASDVAAMLPYCVSQRDRAFIFLLWDSAARLGEILNLNVGDCKPNPYGMKITVNGKTGKRDIIIIDSVPDVQLWLNLYKGKPDDPLFPKQDGQRLAHRGAQTLLLRLQQKAGLTNKRIWVHGFRHGRLTELSNLGMTEPMLRLFAGWEPDSDMPATYIHTQIKDMNKKLLQIKGIDTKDEDEIDNIVDMSVKKCPRCGTENPYSFKFCGGCSLVLDVTAMYEMDTLKGSMQVVLEKLILENPDILRQLVEKKK